MKVVPISGKPIEAAGRSHRNLRKNRNHGIRILVRATGEGARVLAGAWVGGVAIEDWRTMG